MQRLNNAVIEQQIEELRKEIAEIENPESTASEGVINEEVIDRALIDAEPSVKELSEGDDLTRYSFDELTEKAAIRGYLRGLEAEGYPMETLPSDFARLLENPDYELSAPMWNELIRWDFGRQAKAAYPIFEEVHLWRALRAIQIGGGPLGILKGREHLALPLELAGKFHFEQMTKELHPLLMRFALDKGATQDRLDASGINYPELNRLFYAKRRALHENYNLKSYDALARFIMGKSRTIGWPKALYQPFANSPETMLDGIARYAEHSW